jgi:mannose/fructose/N-acetylgalactosamine-specific phosphotransferase system component IIC
VIPPPLTLLFCWLLGYGVSRGVETVVGFILEIVGDLGRWNWLTGAAFDWTERGVEWAGILIGAAGFGFVMRLLGERSRRKAAAWAFAGAVLAAWAPYFGFVTLRIVASAIAGAWPTVLLNAAGCFLGAVLCESWRDRRELEGAQAMLRPLMFWERGPGPV